MKGQMVKVLIENSKIKQVIPNEIKINEYFQPELSNTEFELPKEDNKEGNQNDSSFKIKAISKNLPNQLVNCIYTVSGIPSPKSIAFTPNGEEFWVTSLMNKSRGVVVFEAKTGKHKQDIILPGGGGVEIIFNSEGSLAFVSQMETGRVFEIDAKTKKILRIFNTESTWTKVLTLSPDQKLLYASNWSGNDISVISLETGKVLYKIPTVSTPRGIYATEDGNTLYVAGFGEGEIQKINLKTKTSSVLYKSGGAMRHIVGDEEKGVFYFSDMGKNTIFRIDMKTNEVKEFVKTDANPNTIALTPDKKVLIVSNRGRNHPSGNYNIPGPEWGSVLFFDTATGKMLDALVGGNQPTGLAISPNGRYLAYSNFLDGNIVFCEIPSFEKLISGNGGRSSVYRQELKK
jgi:YVTN family beta-propeller protein